MRQELLLTSPWGQPRGESEVRCRITEDTLRRTFWILLALSFVAASAGAQVTTYRRTDSNGKTICTTYNTDGSVKTTYCHNSLGNAIDCDSYGLSLEQTHCQNNDCTTYGPNGIKQTHCTLIPGQSNFSCTSYNSDGSIRNTYCQTSLGNTINCTSYESGGTQQTVVSQPSPGPSESEGFNQGYAAGEAIGAVAGAAIRGAVENHRINSFCKTNPTSTFHTSEGLAIPCPNAPIDPQVQAAIDSYCRDNPGSWMAVGKHRVNCFAPPTTPNLKWAQWEMNGWRAEYKHRSKENATMSDDQVRADWNYWQPIYCSLAPPRAKYKGLDGKKRSCSKEAK